MVWVFGYDYNGQSGEYWNELYTYDKVWNDSSIDDTQKITGINTNNYWIQRYGVDFAPYRAMGWHDVNWRRPNQRRSGGINIGQSGSSPMEYTNGSHPRYFHLGNRFVGVCSHCVRSVGLKTGKAVFISATGATLEYDIQDWTSSADSKITGRSHEEASNVYYRTDGTTGAPWNSDEDDFWRDCRVFRLTTDPSDDGIPAIKKVVVGEVNSVASPAWSNSIFTNYNILRISGLGVVIPFKQGANSPRGLGGPVGGFGPAQIWSGDSGTMQLVMNPSTGEWFVTQVSNSNAIPDLSATLRVWTGDTDYETLQPFTKDEDHYYRLENPSGLGSTGATYSIMIPMIEGVSAAAALTAQSAVNTVTSVVEIETVLSSTITPIKLNSGQIIIGNHANTGINASNELWVPYGSDVYTLEREIDLRIENRNATGEDTSIFSWISDPSITQQYGFLRFQTHTGEVVAEVNINISNPISRIPINVGITAAKMVEHIGTTLTCELGVYDISGSDSISKELYVRGFTSATGPGLTYNPNTNVINFNLNDGTQPNEFSEFPFGYEFTASWDQDGGHVIRDSNVEGSFRLPSIPSRDGQTFDIENSSDTRIHWSRNDGYIVQGVFMLEGITYVSG